MFKSIAKPLFIKTTHEIVMLVVFLCLSIATASAGQVTLAWDASTSSNVAGYHVVYGQTSNNYTTEVDAGNSTQYTVANLQDGKTYYFAVHARNADNSISSANSNEVSKALSVVVSADFSADKTTGTGSLTVNFTDLSTNATAWSWNFGDGGTSTAQNPSHTYAAGTYTVSLTASGPTGSTPSTKTITGYITVSAATTAPKAIFTTSSTVGPEPLTVILTDQSTGSISSRVWNFGDGTGTTVTTAQTFVRNYAYRSTPYTVSLTVTGSAGTNTTTQTITAQAVQPQANFSATPTTGMAPMTTNFTNTSTGTITSYAWNFGDGGTSTATNPSYTYAKAGTYAVSLTANGPTGVTPNTKTIAAYVTVSEATAGIAGLVAAYNFEEAKGGTVVDASGNGNHGVLSGAKRTASGKFGRDLSFDGSNDWVTVNDSATLDLTTSMTLEAWVYPTTVSGNRTVLVKENAPGNSVYYLYANTSDDSANTPLGGGVFAGQYQFVHGGSTLTANAWSHVAITYNGTTERLYVNGNQVASKAQTGSIGGSSGALRIGGNSMWGEYFKGRIDEIRIYNRALSATEIQTDRNTAVATSSPPKLLLGNQTIGSVADSIPQRMAAAFRTTASVTGQVTSLPVYVDTASASTKLVAGIYRNNNGHPGALLAKGTLNYPIAGVWNKVLLPATTVSAGTTYWVAILSPNGMLKFRDKAGSTAQPSETSASTTLTTLPSTWATGTISTNGPLSGYGAGY